MSFLLVPPKRNLNVLEPTGSLLFHRYEHATARGRFETFYINAFSTGTTYGWRTDGRCARARLRTPLPSQMTRMDFMSQSTEVFMTHGSDMTTLLMCSFFRCIIYSMGSFHTQSILGLWVALLLQRLWWAIWKGETFTCLLFHLV